MSKQAINQYYNRLDQYKRFGGTRNENSVRRAFANLLEEYCLPKHLVPVDEVRLKSSRRRPDGTVKDALQLDWGHWESKDLKDDLDEEIKRKFEIGYPKFNIIFENSEEIVLFQQGSEIMRHGMRDADALHAVLTEFVSYQRPEIKEFHLAVEKFGEDIPDIIEALRSMISKQEKTNKTFRQANAKFQDICRESINPDITASDTQEMLIQHILTAEIFDTVFGESHFHRENSIAKELDTVVGTFFTGTLRRNTLSGTDSYYKAIRAEAARIGSHHEKQRFLKVIYENFYKSYNPKGADRLGIVYTPGEIVRFMIESTDFLLEKHFGRSLADRNVEILDPATGTGTFITELIECIPPRYLEHKYKNEMHANEVAILPYHIANLNIEYTYQQKMGRYEPFENIVFVDTLDNLGFEFGGKQGTLDGFGMSAENLERIKKQNERKISVIIGNPPYNAKQQIYNDFNPNKKYKKVDERIRETYSKSSSAQNKNQIYDMYLRFFRWASDRIDRNGIICFITNHSYIHALAFEGVRKCFEKEFDHLYIVDLGGDIRNKNSNLITGNVFGIITGVAIAFLVRTHRDRHERGIVSFSKISDELDKREKLEYLISNQFRDISFMKTETEDDAKYWLQRGESEFENLLSVIDKDVKSGKSEKAIFQLFSSGAKSQRDDWVYDFSETALMKKIRHFVKVYQETLNNPNFEDKNSIKWDRELTKYLTRGVKKKFEKEKIIRSVYRPFSKKFFYFDKHFNGMTYQWFNIPLKDNYIIGFISGTTKPFSVFAATDIMDLNSISPAAGGAQCLPLYRYEPDGSRTDNITDWGLQQFTRHYPNRRITKENIFHYAYAVLHNPAYRRKYEINLKREFPRLPFYRDFRKWVRWGKALTDLHIGYETVKPYNLKILEIAQKKRPRAKLRAVPEKGEIILDENTAMTGIPAKAWDYKLGNRSALHWILDQHKEKKPRDRTIAEKFNTYRFADYRETVIDLLKRVCAVSVKTADIVNKMAEEERHDQTD